MDYLSLGLSIIENFISDDEENNIVRHLPKTNKIKTNSKRRNNIYRYGSNLPYKDNIISEVIPEYLAILGDRLYSLGLVDNKPNSVSINEYLIGNSITPHIDSKDSGENITILSLLSDATMVFSKSFEQFSIKVPNKSVIQLKGTIRYDWKHSIPPVKNKRYSIVFRYGS